MPIPIMLAIGAGALIGSAIKTDDAKGVAEGMYNSASSDAARWERELTRLKESRPTVKNPYRDMTNAFANMKNPYAKMTNQYANLGVATQAAEYQAEQADISLANTLDTIAMSGMGSGGATALAQAALQSKRGISADIQKQEAQNQKLKAQGAMAVQEAKAAGQMQVDTMKAQGEEKVMQLQGMGDQFMQQIEESRVQQDMNNAANMQMNYMQMANDAQAGMMQADMAQANMFGDIGSSFMSAGLSG